MNAIKEKLGELLLEVEECKRERNELQSQTSKKAEDDKAKGEEIRGAAFTNLDSGEADIKNLNEAYFSIILISIKSTKIIQFKIPPSRLKTNVQGRNEDLTIH